MASFNNDLFKQLLTTIEYNIKFSVEGTSAPQSYDLICNISIEEILALFNKTGQKYKLDELKYCISVLRTFDYIHVSEGIIDGITTKGLQFIMSNLHNIDLI